MISQHFDKLSTELLVLRCLTGQSQALTQLAERFDAPARYFVSRMLGSAAGVEDIVQDVWLTVIRELPRLKASAAFSTWFYRIARNKTVDHIRRHGKMEPCDTDALEALPESNPEQPAFDAQEAAAVHLALERISPLHREALLLRFLEEMSYEQMAQVIGCSIGTVRSRLFHAKSALHSVMERSHVA